MKRFFQHVFGLNDACVIRGFRFGPREFWNACNRGLGAVSPFENREKVKEVEILGNVPEALLDEIIGDAKVELRFTMQRFEEGMLPDNDALALLSMLAVENPKEVLESGTFIGCTTDRKPGRISRHERAGAVGAVWHPAGGEDVAPDRHLPCNRMPLPA